MPLVANHVSTHSSKNLDSAIIVNLYPQNVLCSIFPDAADDVTWVKEVVPLRLGKQMLTQIVPHELESLGKVSGGESPNNLGRRSRGKKADADNRENEKQSDCYELSFTHARGVT